MRDGLHVVVIQQIMQTIEVVSEDPSLDQPGARVLADEVAQDSVDVPILLAWYDRDRNIESPAHTSECHDGCDVPGYLDYAESRGASIRVRVDGGRFVFCYRPIGEFANTP